MLLLVSLTHAPGRQECRRNERFDQLSMRPSSKEPLAETPVLSLIVSIQGSMPGPAGNRRSRKINGPPSRLCRRRCPWPLISWFVLSSLQGRGQSYGVSATNDSVSLCPILSCVFLRRASFPQIRGPDRKYILCASLTACVQDIPLRW